MYLTKDDIHAFLHTITVTTCKVVYVMLCVATLAITCTDYDDQGLQYNSIPLYVSRGTYRVLNRMFDHDGESRCTVTSKVSCFMQRTPARVLHSNKELNTGWH